MSATEAPVVLTRVCSLWRSVALTIPHIWAKIHIPIPGHPASSSRYARHLPESALAKRRRNFSKLMKLRCQTVKEWLDRSGTCPLSISLSYPTNSVLSDPLECDVDDELTDPLIQILLSFASRWSDVHFWIPFSLYQKLESRLSNDVLPILQNFAAKVCSRIGHPGGTANIIQAPNLQKLSLDSFEITYGNPTILPSITNQLTHLFFHTSISDHDFFNIIKFCHSLVDCQVKLQAPWPQSHFFPSPLLELNVEQVILPNLEVLKLYDVGGLSFVFRAIKTPSLKELHYKSIFRYSGYDHDCSLLVPAEPLFALLQNTGTSFRTLTIEPSTLRLEDPLICLRMANTVSHLVIRDSRRTIRNTVDMEEDILIRDLGDFDINLLRVVNNPTSTPETLHTEILLPSLDTLEVYGVQKLMDEEILDVLKSRIDASRRGEVSPLRWVKFQFWRQKQNDFRAEVLRYAESAGIAMELELEYPPDALTPYLGRLSPSFLLPVPSVFDENDH